MRVLVTGAAGFIGYHLCKRLSTDGFEVFAVDNFNDSYDPELKRTRARNLLRLHNVTVAEEDFSETDFFFFFQFDVVVHLAAHVMVRESMKLQKEYIENNVTKTQIMIDRIERQKRRTDNWISSNHHPMTVPKVIYASTSCVAAGQPLPWREDEPVRHQLNPYGYTKYVNECQFKMSGIDHVGLRFFTVYGPWGRPDQALFKFTKAILEGSPLTVFNHGSMTRDWTFVDDIIDGIMITVTNFDRMQGQVFNIGRGSPVQLMDFVSEIERKLGRKADIVKADRHPADTLATWADTSKLQAFGYNPKTDVSEGIDRFIHWFRNYYDL